MVIICYLNIGFRVTRKVPSNGGILKQKRIITATWKTERPFQSTYINISLLGLFKIMSVFVNSFSPKLLYSFWGFIKVLSRKAILFFTCLPSLQNPFATVGWSQEGLFPPPALAFLTPPPTPNAHSCKWLHCFSNTNLTSQWELLSFCSAELLFSLVSRCLKDAKHGVQAPKMRRLS